MTQVETLPTRVRRGLPNFFVAALLAASVACGDSGKQELRANDKTPPQKPTERQQSEKSTFGHAVLALGQLSEVQRVLQYSHGKWPTELNCLTPYETSNNDGRQKLLFFWNCRPLRGQKFGRYGEDEVLVATEANSQRIQSLAMNTQANSVLLFQNGKKIESIPYSAALQMDRVRSASDSEEVVYKFRQITQLESSSIKIKSLLKESQAPTPVFTQPTHAPSDANAESQDLEPQKGITEKQHEWHLTWTGQIHVPQDGEIYLTHLELDSSYDFSKTNSSKKQSSAVTDFLEMASENQAQWNECGLVVGDFQVSLETSRMSKVLKGQLKSTKAGVESKLLEEAFEWAGCEPGHFAFIKNFVHGLKVAESVTSGKKIIVANPVKTEPSEPQ